MKNWWATAVKLDLWLIGILAVAAALRLIYVTQPLVDGFSWREASTAMMADNFHTRSWNIFYPEVSWTGPGPSYQGREFQIVSYITAIAYAIFGWHEWFGRAVAACFGLGSVVSLYLLTQAVWDRTHARAVALAMAILPGAVFIDRSFLPDPAMLTLTATALYLFVKYIDNGRGLFLATSCCLLTLGILAKLPGIAIGIPFAYLALEATFVTRRYPVRWLLLVAGCGLASLFVVFGYYSWALYLGNAYPPYHVAGSGYIWQDGLRYFIDHRFFVGALFGTFNNWFLTPAFAVVAGIGLLWGVPNDAGTRGRWVYHAWFSGAVLIYLFGAREITSNPWNLLIAAPPLAAFVARGVCVIAGGTDRSSAYMARLAAVGIVLVATGTLPAHLWMGKPFAEQAYGMGQALNNVSSPGDLVVTVAPTVGDPIGIYYSRRRGWVFPPGGGETDWSVFQDDAQSIETLDTLRAEGAGWFGYTTNAKDSQNRRFTDHHKQLLAHLEHISVHKVSTDDYVIYQLK